MTGANDHGRRKDQRHTLALQVEYPGRNDELSNWTENLSAGGLFVRTDEPLVKGDCIAIEVSFPGLLDPVALDTTVVWTRPATAVAPRGVGVQAVGEQGRRLLADIAAIAATSAPDRTAEMYRVLVVEDNVISRRLYLRVLKHYGETTPGGIDARVAEQGRQALDALAKESFDLVITDLYMPVMDGFEMVATMRADPRLKSTPVLMITCGGGAERVTAKRIGVDAYLEKPVPFGDIMETIVCLRHLKRCGRDTPRP